MELVPNGKRYSHILPKEKYWLSILPSFRDEFWEWLESSARECSFTVIFTISIPRRRFASICFSHR